MEPLIKFIDKDHSYWRGDRQLPSVSAVSEKFQEPFDTNFFAHMEAFKQLDRANYDILKSSYGWDNPLLLSKLLDGYDKKAIDAIVKATIKEWDDYSDLRKGVGTEIHNKRERRSYEAGFERNPWTNKSTRVMVFAKTYDNQSVVDDLSKLPDGCYLELLVFDLKYGYCGQVDKMFIETHGKERWVFIDDYKTDKTISKSSIYSPYKRIRPKLKYPFNWMQDCNFSLYTVKMGLYAFTMERAGFVIKGIRITHIDLENNEAETYHEVKYHSALMKRALDHVFK